MTDLVIDIQTRVPTALKQMEGGVGAAKLARRLRHLGVRADQSTIMVKLTELAPTAWGRKFAMFVGGSPDPLDQFLWTFKE